MLTLDQAVWLQSEIVKSTGGTAGIADEKKLVQILARPHAVDGVVPKYPALLQKISVMMQGILFERPFVSANRRTALAAAATVLHASGYRLRVEAPDYERFAQGVELGITSWHRVTAWLKGHTVREQRAPDLA